MPAYPGTPIRQGHRDAAAVQSIQRRLKQLGYGPFAKAGAFDAATEAAVRLFQAQHVDAVGMPQVDRYLATVGVKPGAGTAAKRAWCAAFTYWCFDTAAQSLNVTNPSRKTGGV